VVVGDGDPLSLIVWQHEQHAEQRNVSAEVAPVDEVVVRLCLQIVPDRRRCTNHVAFARAFQLDIEKTPDIQVSRLPIAIKRDGPCNAQITAMIWVGLGALEACPVRNQFSVTANELIVRRGAYWYQPPPGTLRTNNRQSIRTEIPETQAIGLSFVSDRYQETAERLSPAWTLKKGRKTAECVVWTNQLGFELRLTIAGEIIQTQGCRLIVDAEIRNSDKCSVVICGGLCELVYILTHSHSATRTRRRTREQALAAVWSRWFSSQLVCIHGRLREVEHRESVGTCRGAWRGAPRIGSQVAFLL
jgi:hypothetical protein